ncbi:PTS fructose transporter subunit IIC [Vibrio algarum]|uniref:protein-N(pi)-phosphohistidine--D-fructose phosphotransferase n=1 Tax=Vibrio algarum TaxID=3020714 RepID=A0ABT4YW40_9VIBR|nr:fructose-specific PTS transporter subunit EIIC [Vibrio sp. KJ40-1]MDB1125776.1 fructose-specific PTS transporter subunit EIIC [Vibrio sp. KJ40-1]
MKILAITACTAGVAHTYMAAKTLENKAKARGYEIKVEKQGANGIDDRITAKDVAEASGIIFATDVGVAEMERFDGLLSVQGKVKDGIKKADEMIDALEQKIEASGGEKKASATSASNEFMQEEENNDNFVMKFLKSWYKGALSGVSHIIPLVIIGGLCVGLLNLFFGYDYTHLYDEAILTEYTGKTYADLGIINAAEGLANSEIGAIKKEVYAAIAEPEAKAQFESSFQGIMHFLYYSTLKAFNPLLICVLAAFTAYGMVGKPGLAPGFVGGYVAVGGGFGKISIMTGGFLGGLVAGAAAALFVMLVRQIKVPAVLESVKMIIITPLLAGVLTLLFMYAGPGKFFATLNSGLVDWLTSMGTNNLLILGFILGAMACFDMGGPVNKAAYMFCIGVGTSGSFLGDASIFYAAFTAAKCIPGMSLGIMSFVFKRFFDKEDRLAGPSTAILGFCGITEGAIPYAVKDPMRIIPAHMIGGGIAAGLILSSKITIGTVAGGAVFMLPVISEPLAWLTYFVIGIAVSMALTIGLKMMSKQGKAEAKSEAKA